jgi:cell division protein FtsZ
MAKSLPKIKVVGIGGAGGNAISRMAGCEINGVELIAINTDFQDLKDTKADIKIRIGKRLTEGLGTGMNPEKGRKAVEENKEEIANALKGSDMVFLTCGLGGGTGTGALPPIAEIARSNGALTIAVVTTPFSFEGKERGRIAKKGLKMVQDNVDTLIPISNDRLLSTLDANVTLLQTFWACDEILRQAVQGISDLITLPGIINIDFADVRAIMKDSGSALFGKGVARGKRRAEEAALRALNLPLVDLSCKNAKGVLFNVNGGKDLSLSEVNEIAEVIKKHVSPNASIIFGAVEDKNIKEGEIKVTVIATGF